MEDKKATRIMLFTGKGGVGKTTLAAATALRIAGHGYKTLIISTDPAHSLADSFDKSLGPEPQEISPNLEAMEVDLYYSMKKHWGNLRELLLAAFKWQGVERIASEEMAAIPGMEEASAMLWLEELYSTGKYDAVIIDSAPTGETLTFLTLPQTLRWWIERALPFQRKIIMAAGVAVRLATGIPLDRGFEELEKIYIKLERVHKLLSDPDISTIRLVVNPERMVLKEGQRAYTYLQIYGYPVDAVLVNRIWPSTIAGTAFGKYLKAQQIYLEEIEQSFAPLPVLHVPHLGQEAFGIDLLTKIGETLYKDKNPLEILFSESLYKLAAEGKDYLLSVRAKFLKKASVRVNQYGDELEIVAGNRQHKLFLPKFLAYYQIGAFTLENGWIKVRFTEPAKS